MTNCNGEIINIMKEWVHDERVAMFKQIMLCYKILKISTRIENIKLKPNKTISVL